MNTQIQEKARELAQLIYASEEYITMRMAEDAASQDPTLTEMCARYYEKRQELEQLTANKDPDFERMGTLNQEMSDIQDEMNKLPLTAAMQTARKSFTDMMNMINQELKKVLDPEYSNENCTGNCASCSGCH